MTEDILQLKEELLKEKENYRRYESYVVDEFKILRKFAEKYNLRNYTLEGLISEIEKLLDNNEATKHSIRTIKEYSNKLTSVTEYLNLQQKFLFEDFEIMQKIKQFKIEKKASIKCYYEQVNDYNNNE